MSGSISNTPQPPHADLQVESKPTGREPVIALPTARLVTAILAACVLAGAGSSILGWTRAFDQTSVALGLCSAGIVAVTMIVGLLAVGPWKPRPVGLWPSFWMGSTALRLLLTPVLTYLLYSVTLFSATALAVNVVAAYVLALISEVAVLVGFLKRTLPG